MKSVKSTEVIRYEVKSLVVIGDFGVQAGEVKPVKNIFLLDFAEVFVSLRREEP